MRGVKSSGVTSWYIRNRRKSGEKSQAEEEAQTQAAGAEGQ